MADEITLTDDTELSAGGAIHKVLKVYVGQKKIYEKVENDETTDEPLKSVSKN